MIAGHPRRLALAVLVLTGLFAAPHAYPMLEQIVAKGFSGNATYNEVNGGTQRGDLYIGVTGKGTFSGSIRGVAAIAAFVAGKVTGVPYRALAKGGTYTARYDIDAQNNYTGTVVAKFISPGLGAVCLSYSLKHGAFKPGMHFFPASGTVTITGGTGQAAQLHGGATFKQTDITGAAIETFLGKGLIDLKMGSRRPMSSACKAAQKIAG